MASDSTRENRKVPYSHHVEDQIRKRAYEIYETRGREDGHDLDDWVRAEQEIVSKETRKAAA